jgi:roadblock/LC7 domain-containing protein
MSHIDKLMELDGALAAGTFTKDGRLVEYRGELNRDWAQMIANLCAANTLMGAMQCESFSIYTGMNWKPFKGWAMSAGDYSICSMGQSGVLLETAKADFNRAFEVLEELREKFVDSEPMHST